MSKKAVIENIKKNVLNNCLNDKVEVDDPVLSDEERNKLIYHFYDIRKKKFLFKLSSIKANLFIDILAKKLDKDIDIVDLDKLPKIDKGIITSNHFNPMDSMPIRKVIKSKYGKVPYIVSDDENLALPKFLSYLINHLNIIPLKKETNYIIHEFKPKLKEVLDDNNFVLIFPEEEMWYNYRKPRPCKRGAYQFAAEFNVPVIPFFVELIDTNIRENDEFNKVKFRVYVLDPIYPDPHKSVRENSIYMANKDYEEKKVAYEKAYNKKLTYDFSLEDIAGLRDDIK